MENGLTNPDPRRVIAMSLPDSDPVHTWGVVRNAQLVPVIFPGWTLHIYTSQNLTETQPMTQQQLSASNQSHIPEKIIKTVESLGAKVILLDAETSQTVPSSMWHYLVADQPDVEVFLIRNPDERLTTRDRATIDDWMASEKVQIMHSIKDHPRHSNSTIIDGMWGAQLEQFNSKFEKISMQNIIQNYMDENQNTKDLKTIADVFLKTFLQPKFEGNIMFYDSITCDKQYSVPFPVERKENIYIGQKFDAHERPLVNDKLDLLASRNPECES